VDPFIDVVYLGNVLGMMLGFGIGHDGLSYRAEEEILTRHQLTERDLETFGAQVVAHQAQVKEMFAVDRED